MDIAFGGGGLRITANVAYRKDKRVLSAEVVLGGIGGEASTLKGNKCTKVPKPELCLYHKFARLIEPVSHSVQTQICVDKNSVCQVIMGLEICDTKVVVEVHTKMMKVRTSKQTCACICAQPYVELQFCTAQVVHADR